MKQKASKQKQGLASCDPGELFNELGRAVYGYAVHILRDSAQAEDVLSETFLRVCRRKDQYREHGNIRSWVMCIAQRLCIDVLRSKLRQGQPVSFAESLASSDPSPAQRSEENEQKKIIVEAIEKLPDEQREVVMLKVYGELTFRQISETLGIPLNTALGRMHLATKRLAMNPSLARIGREANEL